MGTDTGDIRRHCEDGERLFFGDDGVYAAEDSESSPSYFSENTFSIELSNGSNYRITPPNPVQSVVSGVQSYTNIPQVWLVFSSPATIGLVLTFLLMFAAQSLVFLEVGMSNIAYWEKLFVLNTENLGYVWTWVTSMFAHGGVVHFLVNSLVFLMFAPLAEHHLGSKRYLVFFVFAGLAASGAQVAAALVVGSQISIVGASGAIAGTLGYLGMREPDLRVYFFAIIPMPFFVLNLILIGGSLLVVAVYGVGAFGVAHMAHAGGALFGLLIGALQSPKPVEEYLSQTIVWRIFIRFREEISHVVKLIKILTN